MRPNIWKKFKISIFDRFSIISSFISPPVYVGKEQATCEGDSNIVEGKVLHLWKLNSLHRHIKVKLSKVNITFISFPLNAFFCELRSRSNSFIGLKAILYRLLEWYHPHTARRRFRGLLQVCLIFGPLHVSGWSFRIVGGWLVGYVVGNGKYLSKYPLGKCPLNNDLLSI